jgi:SAM-dependent methyltransferase
MSNPAARTEEEIHTIVRERYANIARTGAPVPEVGCSSAMVSDVAQRIGYDAADLNAVPEGANLGLGCGAPIAAAGLQPGEIVLDLGSGAGFDAFLAAREVGDTGRVIGVDMTPEMLARANDNAAKIGARNVEFRSGRIEALPVENASVDVVMSNCVINLVPDKAAVYREIARVLRPGGRMVISDIVLDAPLPPFVAESVAALTGCVAGAARRHEYLETIAAAGLADIEVLSDKSFGEMALTMAPAELIEQARNAGIDVENVARTVRSLTIRARKAAVASVSDDDACCAPSCCASVEVK